MRIDVEPDFSTDSLDHRNAGRYRFVAIFGGAGEEQQPRPHDQRAYSQLV
jgi:hypothetical protein